MTVSLDDYPTYFSQLEYEVQQFRLHVNRQLENSYNSTQLQTYQNSILPLVQHEVDQFNTELGNLKKVHFELQQAFSSQKKGTKRQRRSPFLSKLFRSITRESFLEKAIPAIAKTIKVVYGASDDAPRHKRAVLGFLGPLLGSVFGITTNDQLDSLKSNIELLRRRGDTLSSALGHNVAILNETRADVTTNRNMLNKLSHSVRITRGILQNTINDLKNDIATEFQFNHFINHLHSMIHLSNSVLRRLGLSLQLLQHDLSLAWDGKLSSTLLCSEQLRRLLNQIRKRVDKSLSLPFPLRISEYYKHLPVIMAYDSDIHLAMIIPLIKSDDQFELFKTAIIPKRVKKNLYYWDTESEYVAISVDRSRFVYLNQAEFDTCQLGFCTLNSSIYQVQDSTSCLMTAFLGNEIDTKRNCNYRIDPFPSSVVCEHIAQNNWLILSRKPWPLTVICDLDKETQRNTTVININTPVYVLTLRPTCRAKGRYFDIPKIAKRQMKKDLKHNQLSIIRFTNWTLSEPTFQIPDILDIDNSDIPDTLSSVPDRSNALQDIVSQLRPDLPWQDMDRSPSQWTHIIAYILIGLCFLFVVILVIFLQWYRFKRILCCKMDRTDNTTKINADELPKAQEPLDNSEAIKPLHPIDCDFCG